MINISECFSKLDTRGTQQKIHTEKCPLRVYCGLSTFGNYILSIMASNPAPNMESTKSIRLTQLVESEGIYWINFELLDAEATRVFFSFCSDIIDCISVGKSEEKALVDLVNRYYIWRTMFKKSSSMSEEKTKGLFGELFFLYDYMIPHFGVESAINAWSGPSKTSKDFSIQQKWYEVKTTSTSSNVVKISSITQLSSKDAGILVVIKTERMSPEFNDNKSSVNDMFNLVLDKIEIRQLKDVFLHKIIEYGFDASNDLNFYKFRVDDMKFYKVTDKFPRITEKDIKFKEISNIQYEIKLDMIQDYIVKE